MKFLMTIFNVIICSIFLNAQSGIRGVVIDQSQTALPGASIYLEETDFGTITDINGKYEMFNIPQGKYNLNISYIGYSKQSLLVDIKENTINVIEIIMDEGSLLSEIVVNGQLEGQSKALNAQKNNINITQIVSKEQIESYPDANIGDALKRLSGINVQYDQGEARFANIRGLSPELNSVTINGDRIPSAEAEKRFVQLDLVPADIVETIELSKAVTPDMDGDAIGGAINLITKKAPKEFHLSTTLGSGYSFLGGKPLVKGRLTVSDRFFNDKIGIIISGSVLNKSVRSDNIEPEWDYSDENDKEGSSYLSEMQIRQYFVTRLRQSYNATLDYQLNKNHNIYISGMYNWRNDWENRYRFQIKGIELDESGQYIGEIRRQTKGGSSDNRNGRLEDQKMYSIKLGGEHFFNKIKADWTFSSLTANESRPNERYITLRDKDQPLSLSLDDIEYPKIEVLNQDTKDLSTAYSLKELTEEFQFTEETDYNARLNLNIPLKSGKNKSSLKIGASGKFKSKLRDNKFKEYSPIDEDMFVSNILTHQSNQTNDDFQAGNYQVGSFISKEHLGEINFDEGFEGEKVLEELAGNFNAKENVFASYAMYNQDFNKKLNLLIGARYEYTEVQFGGKIFDGEQLTESKGKVESYGNFMPGVHLKYQLSNWTNLRLAWTNTIARPNYYDLVPYQEIETEDNFIKVGNPSLKATTSMNFDLLVDHYFKNIGIISGSAFYKKVDNVIADRTLRDYEFESNVYDQFTQPINIGNANLFGFEIGVQRRLDFLPGFLKQLSLNTNYTYTYSKLDKINLEGRENEELPLAGTPKNLFNVSIAYDNKSLNVRLSYSFADSFIEEYNSEAFFDRWYDKVNYLDFNTQWNINKKWQIYMSVNNILNQPLRYYQGTENKTMQAEFYGVHSKIGVKYSI